MGVQRQSASPKLELDFHGRIIEHLGLQMYQSPTAALAELISNAWDADASHISISLPADLTADAVIALADDGNGMTLEEVQRRFLKVGSNRRKGETSERSPLLDRAILGRKGIGKFAGFGIARRMLIETISRETGEKTVFELDYDRIRGVSEEYVEKAPLEIDCVSYEPPDSVRLSEHGTKITLQALSIARRPPAEQLCASMSRRFSFGASISNFQITVDGMPVPEDADLEKLQFSFPRDYLDGERPADLREIDGEWGVEGLSDGTIIRWRYRFYEDPINETELVGVAVYASGKIAQMPFLFNLAGGLGGQHGAAYMAGRVEANFLDNLPRDIISPERQRVDWDAPESAALLEWGRRRTQDLLRFWKARRGEDRQRRLRERMAPVDAILEGMRSSERRPLAIVLKKLAMIESIDDQQYLAIANALVTAWQAGRLRDLIDELSEADTLDEARMIQILLEANVLTDLQMAEIVRTKIEVVRELRRRVEAREVENALRDYIAEHPELISPQWSTFRRETRVTHIVRDAANASGIEGHDDFRGRIDLALSSGTSLLILEFMRPGITLDVDHVQRFERYISEIRPAIRENNALGFDKVLGYIVADNRGTRPVVSELIARMSAHDEYVMTWATLLASAESQWTDQMNLLELRSGEEPRIQALANP